MPTSINSLPSMQMNTLNTINTVIIPFKTVYFFIQLKKMLSDYPYEWPDSLCSTYEKIRTKILEKSGACASDFISSPYSKTRFN